MGSKAQCWGIADRRNVRGANGLEYVCVEREAGMVGLEYNSVTRVSVVGRTGVVKCTLLFPTYVFGILIQWTMAIQSTSFVTACRCGSRKGSSTFKRRNGLYWLVCGANPAPRVPSALKPAMCIIVPTLHSLQHRYHKIRTL